MSSKFILFFTLLLSFPLHNVASQGIRGRITDTSGQPVAFATVYIQELHQGTTANMDGEYILPVKPGVYDFRFQYMGYKTRVVTLQVNEGYQEVDVVMEEQQYSLPEVVVTASGEDPAYYIMRKAIAMSQYYLNQVSEYRSRVYLKGSGVLTKIPALMRRQLEREGVEQDRYFVTETLSEIEYRMPGETSTRVISTRSSGDDSQTSPMAFVTISLYQDINGIISPLSRNAFQVYRFRLEGSFLEDGYQVNKIRVIPRRSGPDLYSGYIYIRDGSWNLHTVDLQIEQSLFTASVRQVYNPVGQGVWMPVSHDFRFEVAVMGLEMEYTYVASVSDYEIILNPNIDHGFYRQLMESDLFLLETRGASDLETRAPEIRPAIIEKRDLVEEPTPRQKRIAHLMEKDNLTNRQTRQLNRLVRREAREGAPRRPLEVSGFSMEMEDSARLRTHEYWEQNRPVPLTAEEWESFGELPEDTLGENGKSFTAKPWREILLGGQGRLSPQWRYTHNGLAGLSSWGFNTVDGLLYTKNLRFTRSLTSDRNLTLANSTSWAFDRKALNTDFRATFSYDPFRRASAGLHAGVVTRDFNRDGGMHRLVNSVAILLLQKNDLKLLEQDYLRVWHNTDIINGLVLETSAEYARRRALENHSKFHFTSWSGNEFTPNIPDFKGFENDIMPSHRAMIMDARLSYTHRHYYMRVGERKQMLYSYYPTLSLNYREAFEGIAGSNARFRLLEAGISQSFTLRMIGQFSYIMRAGRFFNAENLYTPDFRHFKGNSTWVMSAGETDRFRSLGFYENSAASSWAEAHLHYEHGRILLKRIPFMARTLIREQMYVKLLATEEHQPYLEVGYGLNQVFLLFNLEVVTGFRGGRHNYTGFRIGMPLGGEASIRM